MRLLHTVLLAWSAAASCGPVSAAESPLPASAGNLFIDALRNGDANVPAPGTGLFEGALRSLQDQTGNPGQIFVKAKRAVRFEQQAHCGRVVFALWQPASNHAWPALGGQLNICEDGLPPLRVCDDRPRVLVPHIATCRDKSAPHDTAEVAAAISTALASGDITPEQAQQRARQQAAPASGARP